MIVDVPRMNDSLPPASPRGFAPRTWNAILLSVPPVIFLGLAVVAALSLLWGKASSKEAGPEAHMHDVAAELSSDIHRTALQGLAKTNALALDPRLPEVIATGDRDKAEAFANELLKDSLELDIVAIFDAEGALLAVNNVGHDGVRIPRERLDVLYNADFSERGVVQGCLRDTTVTSSMEFQTKCDFTPPIFGSSGLSVAFSAPVPGPGGARAGVVSTRLNFARVTALVEENAFVKAGNAIHLVTDEGGFFDEDINAGRKPAPLTTEQVLATVRTDDAGAESDITVHRDGLYLLGRRVATTTTVDGGGINVLLCASQEWVHGEAARAKQLAGGALLAALLAAAVWGMFIVARTRQHQAQAALGAERARTSVILENVGEGVLSADASGRITFANHAACALLGYEPGGLVGRDVSGVFADPSLADVTTPWRVGQTTLVRKDGCQLQARATCTVLPGGTGGVIAVSDLSEKIETDRKLLEATRQAGMAEVATGVLHNVGNVLNSVNVAACVVTDKLKASEIPNLVRAGDMLREHRTELPQYLAADERGKFLPDFLIEVAQTLGAEQRSMLQELEAVTRGIEHVKHVVNLQQEHAKKSTVAELVRPADIMETALQLQLDSLSRHQVTIERRFEALPPVVMDKHLVLQILVNLITNARQAVQGIAPEQRKIILAIREDRPEDSRSEERRFNMEVIDNGMGIAPENLERIFGQGFTTKKDGHGFGLHSSANAAKQMGGSLAATSSGPGKGARFILTLPMVLRSSVPVHEKTGAAS